jgi:uncharacterized protein (TIGR03067 family)
MLAALLLTLSQQARAAVPPQVASTTVRRALRFSAGNGRTASDMPAKIVQLTEWGLKSLSRRRLRMTIALLVVIGLVAVLGWLFLRPRPVDVSIRNRLQGTWVADEMNMDGIPVPARMQVTFKDNQMTLLDTVGTYRIDAAKNPMQLDWTVQGGVSHWIFELQGDELMLCVSHSPDPAAKDLPRPQDFNPQLGKIVTAYRRLPR